MELSSPAGLSHLATNSASPSPAPAKGKCVRAFPLSTHPSLPASLQVTATHQLCHRAIGAALWVPLTQPQ